MSSTLAGKIKKVESQDMLNISAGKHPKFGVFSSGYV